MQQYYYQQTEHLETYQKLIQYWSMIFSRKAQIDVLDNMNFNIAVFPQLVTHQELLSLHPVEPGYMSPDGYTEMHELIRALEAARLLRQAPARAAQVQQLVQRAGVGCGNGCSNVMNGVLNAILRLPQERPAGDGPPEIMLMLPNYSVYTAQLSNLQTAVRAEYVYTSRARGFLPTFAQIAERATPRTRAVVLTYPNNPAQSTFEGDAADELRALVRFCQERRIFLVVDNIYQDLLFPAGRPFVELFGLADSLDYLVKVYGCSKDTPFFSGFRTGYWFGDPRLGDAYRYYISSTENSLNTYSLGMFALNLYLKLLLLEGRPPALDDMRFFAEGLFGWSQPVVPAQLFERLSALDLPAHYRARHARALGLQEHAIGQVRAFAEASPQFCDYVNDNIGNVFFLRVDPACFAGDDDALFRFLFYDAGCGVLPGSVFGMPARPDEVWFRITLIHETCEAILRSLHKVEAALARRARR